MKIQSSSVNLSGTSQKIELYSKQESLNAWTDKNNSKENALNGLNSSLLNADFLELTTKDKSMSEISSKPIEKNDRIEVSLSEEDKQKILLLQTFFESITGKKFKFYVPEKIKIKDANLEKSVPIASNPNISINGQQPSVGWGLIYESHEAYYEKESMSFSANALIKTSDGKAIKINLEMNMSREFAYRNDISIRAGDAKKIDPLVINFNSPSAALKDSTFKFDLDSDGTLDDISFLNEGSGFLALDLNNDGVINDGSELFGAKSGNGFKDLSAYDSDGNNWIDENDPIYEKLQIWATDSDGNNKLFALGHKGIGAIYLGNVDTEFGLKNSQNQLTGEISKTGIFLRENGSAGTIQHVDFIV